MKLLIVLCMLLPSVSFARKLIEENTNEPSIITDDSGSGFSKNAEMEALRKAKEAAKAEQAAKDQAAKDEAAAKEAKEAQDLKDALEALKKNKDKTPTPTGTSTPTPSTPSTSPIVGNATPAYQSAPVTPANQKKNCQRNAVGMVDPQKRHDELVRCNTLSN